MWNLKRWSQWQQINRVSRSLWLQGRSLFRYGLLIVLVSAIVVACDQSSTQVIRQKQADAALTIWWEKGFALEEDEALQQLVTNWEKQSGQSVKLSFYTSDDLAQRAQRALQSGSPPDLMMSHSAEQLLNPQLAWQGKLLDVSAAIDPIKDTYPPTVLDSVNFYNNVEKKRSYYALPFSQTAMYLFFWRDLVQKAGFDDRNFPRDWNQYWDTWMKIQDQLRQQGENIYSLGFPLSIGSADANHFFEQILEAFDATLLDKEGNLLIGDPIVQKHIQDSLAWITQFYQLGYVPRDAVKWLSPDNNNSLLNRNVVMTPNATLSIPTAVQHDQETYLNKLGTLELPNKPSGQPMRYIVLHRQVVAFAEANHPEAAKQFLAFLVQPDQLGRYLKAGGRNFPVTKPVWEDPFWTNPADPHLSVTAKVLLQDQTRPFYSVYHPAYSVVVQQNVWTEAINDILNNVSVEQATQDAIAKIEQIFDRWQ